MSANVFSASDFEPIKGFERRTMQFIERLRENPSSPSLRVKPLKSAVDPRARTAKVTDRYRTVLIKLEGPKQRHFLLVKVDNHDEASAYAARLRIHNNPVNGVLDFVVEEIEDSEADAAAEIESYARQLAAEKLAKLQAEQEAAAAHDESENTGDSEAGAPASRTET